MAFMDTMTHMLDTNFERDATANRDKAGLLYLKKLFGKSSVEGKSLDDLSSAEVKKAIHKMSKEMLGFAKRVASGVAMVNDKWKDEASDASIDQLTECSDLIWGVVSSVYEPNDPNGQHTTVVKCPRGKVPVSFLLSTIHNLMTEICAQGFTIKDPAELHQVLYNMFISMACAEGNAAARMYMKNIDIANLNENGAVQAMIHDKKKVYKHQPDEDFFDVVLTGNKYKEELFESLRKEKRMLEEDDD